MEALRRKCDPKDVNFLVYHGNCSDGQAGALCGYLVGKNTIQFYPGYFTPDGTDQKLLDMIQNHKKQSNAAPVNLLIVDFSYCKNFMITLSKVCDKLLLLDHHESAQKELGDLDFCYFEQERSGCTLAWEYFMGNVNYPELLKRIEDRDLGRFVIPQNREFTSYFYNLIPFDFEAYKSFIDQPNLIQDGIERGQTIWKLITMQVQKKASTCSVVLTKSSSSSPGKRIAVLNLTENQSECGEHLTVEKGFDFAILWYYDSSSSTIKGSIRSAKGTTNDCSKLGKHLGGGGHYNSAGFVSKLGIEELMQMIRGLEL